MTLNEAIKRIEKIAKNQEKVAKEWHENQVRKCELIPFAEMDYTYENECKKCAEEHRQLTEWLKDYKRLMEQQSCDDCVSREQAKKDVIPNSLYTSEQVIALLDNLSPVTPTHGTCKDCANYVMGALDEEICLRGHELIHKDFYCADYERRCNENE